MFTKKDTQCFRLDPRLDYSKETFKCETYKSASKDPLVPAGIIMYNCRTNCYYLRNSFGIINKSLTFLVNFVADLSYGFITQLNSFIFSNLAPMHARIHKQGNVHILCVQTDS